MFFEGRSMGPSFLFFVCLLRLFYVEAEDFVAQG